MEENSEKRNSGFGMFVVLVVGIFAVSFAGVYFWKGTFDLWGIFAAGVINVLNSLIGFKIILRSLEQKDTKKFYVASLGSMTVRLFVVLFMVLGGLLIFNFNKKSFIFALFCYYFTYLIIETILLVKRINDRKRV